MTTSVDGVTESHVEGLTGVSAVRDDEHALVPELEKAAVLRDKDAMCAETSHFSSGTFHKSLNRWMKDAL